MQSSFKTSLRHFLVCAAAWVLWCLPLPLLTAQETDHKLAPGDSVMVNVYQEDDLSTPKAVLSKEGKISLNLIGEVSVAGMTCTEAARVIETRYKDGYLVKPSVTVAMVDYVKHFYTIGGEVNKPARYVMPQGERLTVQQAIIYAGGFTKMAKEGRAFIKRAGRDQEIEVNLKDKDLPAVYVQPGDTIRIPKSLL